MHDAVRHDAFMHRRQALMHGAYMHCGRVYDAAMSDVRAGIARYLRFVLGELGIKPTRLAKEIGISSTTLTRFLNNPGHNFTLSTTTIQKISSFSGINPAPFYTATTEPDLSDLVYERPSEVYDASWPPHPEDRGEYNCTVVIGEVAAGNFRDLELLDILEQPPLSLKLSFYSSRESFAMVVRGESINRVAQDGDYLVCVRRDALKHRLVSGALVVVQKSKDGERTFEVTAKRLLGKPGAWELWPDSEDPAFQAPLVMTSLEDTDTVKILGEVQYVVRSPHA